MNDVITYRDIQKMREALELQEVTIATLRSRIITLEKSIEAVRKTAKRMMSHRGVWKDDGYRINRLLPDITEEKQNQNATPAPKIQDDS